MKEKKKRKEIFISKKEVERRFISREDFKNALDTSIGGAFVLLIGVLIFLSAIQEMNELTIKCPDCSFQSIVFMFIISIIVIVIGVYMIYSSWTPIFSEGGHDAG